MQFRYVSLCRELETRQRAPQQRCGEERTRFASAGMLSLAFLVLADMWTRARGFLARWFAGSVAIAATEAAGSIIGRRGANRRKEIRRRRATHPHVVR